MNSNLKCPFCSKKLEPIGTSGQFQCGTWGCDASFNFIATRDVWEYIERTRKALEVAVDALNKINMRCQNTVRNHLERATIRGELCDISFYARKAIGDIDNLKRITALEQKEE